MANPPRSSVYLSCRGVFSGVDAQLRKLKTIRERVQKHKKLIGSLASQYTIDSIAVVAKSLLEARIFESTSVAKRHFPELFQVSEARDSARQTLEAEAAKSEAKAVKEEVVKSGDEGDSGLVVEQSRAGMPDGPPPATGGVSPARKMLAVGTPLPPSPPPPPAPSEMHPTGEALAVEMPLPPSPPPEALPAGLISTRLGPATCAIPPLYPTNFPYKAQHQILTTAQSILEHSCFDFGTTWLPELMSSHKWTCPEAVELNKWTKAICARKRFIPEIAVNCEAIGASTFRDILAATEDIRHTAVHRLHTSARGIQSMLTDAIALTEALRDVDATKKLETMAGKLGASIEEAEQSATVLENKLARELANLAERRAALDKLEEEAIENMLREDEGAKIAIGLALGNEILRASTDDGPPSDPKGKGKQRAEVDGDAAEGSSGEGMEDLLNCMGEGTGEDEDSPVRESGRWFRELASTMEGGEEGAIWKSNEEEEDEEEEVFLEFE